ncbi:hypothetical protein LY76DRAFT_676672 [Colletotrichum caudatum]|nr:hypothetical protein LY76DRAFT_676672 [Colletotrichum caudatum]
MALGPPNLILEDYRLRVRSEEVASSSSDRVLQLQERIQYEFGIRVPLVNLFASSSLAAMAKQIGKEGRLSSSESATTSTFDRHVETGIAETTSAALKTSVHHQPASPSSLVVVLTGATGL